MGPWSEVFQLYAHVRVSEITGGADRESIERIVPVEICDEKIEVWKNRIMAIILHVVFGFKMELQVVGSRPGKVG